MTTQTVASDPTRNSDQGTTSGVDGMEKHLLPIEQPDFVYSSFNQEAPLCWSCFLPIFGNRPDMFDGDLLLDSAEDNEVSRCQNVRDQSTQTCDSSSSRSYECMQSFLTPNLVISKADNEDYPLVTGPSPVTMSPSRDSMKQEQTSDAMSFLSDWKIEKTPDLDFSVATEDGESSMECDESLCLDRLDESGPDTSDIYKSNIVGGMEVRMILQQGDMEIPFLARIPFPYARNAWYKGLESTPLSIGSDISVLGRVKIGGQILSFKSRSKVDS